MEGKCKENTVGGPWKLADCELPMESCHGSYFTASGSVLIFFAELLPHMHYLFEAKVPNEACKNIVLYVCATKPLELVDDENFVEVVPPENNLGNAADGAPTCLF